jgi:hypothetical protein
MRMRFELLLVSFMLAGSGVTFAQAPPTPVTPQQKTAPPAPEHSTNCAPAGPRGGTATEESTVGRAGEPLADKLNKSEGVLCPPSGIDPEIRAPTPESGNTPVIPPPGSPGGDPNVRPK